MDAASPGRAPLVYEVALALAVAVAFADSAIVVLALPELYAELETSISQLHWVITAYNAAVVVGAAALFPLLRRARPAVLALLGIAVFLTASLVCALAGDLGTLVGGRVAQGIGAALLLAASLPVLAALSGTRERAVAVWVAAGTLGTAVGPALGGVLTKAFDWRAIFVVQAPLAAAALPAALHPRVRAALPVLREKLRVPVGAALGLLLVSAALVGALFLAVLLVVTVWDYGPLAGAGMVSALPLAALAVRPLAQRLPGPVDVAGGSLLLAAGLIALALLPASSPAYAVPALALAGAGLGLALSPFARAALPEHGELTGSALFSVGVRHAGLVLGLVAVAPLLTAELEDAVDTATLNATAVILDARLPLQQKVPIALDLHREFQQAPEGEVPDLAGPFDERGAEDDEAVRTARDDLRESVEAVLTRAFRSSFVLSAIFALLAAATAVAFHRRGRA